MKPLTDRQRRVLEFIRSGVIDEGMPPTRAEIASALGLKSPNTAEAHLKALVKKGYITLLPGRNRNIRLVEGEAPRGRGIPLVGQVQAGAPMLAAQHIEGYFNLESLFHPPPDYLLRVRGTSMSEAGIRDGDLVAVKRTPEARHGEIVVARLEDEVTVKRFYRRGSQVRLVPENRDFAPIPIDLGRDRLVIEGVVVGLIRIEQGQRTRR